MTASKKKRTIQTVTKTKAPAPTREWAVIDQTGVEPPRWSWFRQNARHVADTLNTRDAGRYKVQRVTKENQ